MDKIWAGLSHDLKEAPCSGLIDSRSDSYWVVYKKKV